MGEVRKSTRMGTKCVHGGQEPEPTTGAVMPPVSLATTYAQSAPGVPVGEFEYSRTDNPTRHALEAAVAALEGGVGAAAFASGMAAVDAAARLLAPGDIMITGEDLYGGSARLFRTLLAPMGVEWLPTDTTAPDQSLPWARASLVWVETPSNPLLGVTDIAALRALAPKAILAVDNTFMSPVLQRPLSHGADLAVHSSTKYLGGHSDVVGGVVVAKDEALLERLRAIQNNAGAVPGPLGCYLTLRGIKTLALRMERHTANAAAMAAALAGHPQVEEVIWPGLHGHPGAAVQARQASGAGGMLSARLRCDAAKAVSGRRYWTLAESLGGVESLLCVPSLMTHASVPPEERARRGIGDNLVRLSCGIEDAADLAADFMAGLEAAGG